MTSTDRVPTCDWRRHAAAETPCGHVACLTCHPERFAEDYDCDYCRDAYDAADELLNEHELHCG